MIKGMLPCIIGNCLIYQIHHLSVMSGIITGPYFLKFFGDPDAIQIGTMVAVLEVGAFGECFCLLVSAYTLKY